MSRIEAEKQLMTPLNSYGSYLIRESESAPGSYAISVRDRDKIRHYKISRLLNGAFFINRDTTFETLQSLAAHYQQQADGLCVNLIKPCNLSKKPWPAGHSRQVDEKWEISDRRQIVLIKKLMTSEFCDVWEGQWNYSTFVAVKTLKTPQTMTVDDFLQTANLMKKLHHPKIEALYALYSKEDPVYIITEFMKHGRLLDYLRGEGRSLKLPQLIDIAAQVAAGMAYLEEQNVIHRSLTAKNILVTENLLCKVASFEMAREINGYIDEILIRDKSAVKWTAPEAALYNRYSIKSDVWSFGTVLYEIITYGRFLYPGMTNDQVLECVQQGYRIPRPMGCPDKFYNIMLNCWREEPANRPTFKTLQWQLEEFFTTDNSDFDLEQSL